MRKAKVDASHINLPTIMFLMHILMMYTCIAAFTAPSGELPSFDSPKSVSFALAFAR